jgi:hypothetical protein
MSRLLRGLAAAVLAGAVGLSPLAAGVALAEQSATLEIVFGSGTGVGRITSDPGGIDCTWNGSSRSGDCVGTFIWPNFIATGIDVDLIVDPDSHSYGCYGQSCGSLDGTFTVTVHLNAGDDKDVFPVINLGVRAVVKMSPSGPGDGRITTEPSGLNCRWLDGTQSGTCQADYWFVPAASYVIRLLRTPDAGSYACSDGPPFCGSPGQTYASNLTISPDYLSGVPATFYEAKPVTVKITGQGSVVSKPAGIDCPAKCSVWLPPNYSYDDFTKLTATPAAGWHLADWTWACNSTVDAVCSFQNQTDGAKVGVEFAPNSTPKPSTTPRPTATPRATPRPTPAASAAPTPAPVGAPTAGPAGSAAPLESAPESAPASDPGATGTPPGASTGPDGSPITGGVSRPSPAPTGDATVPVADSSGVDSGVDSGLLVVLAILGLVLGAAVVGIGFALGRRGGRRGARRVADRA